MICSSHFPSSVSDVGHFLGWGLEQPQGAPGKAALKKASLCWRHKKKLGRFDFSPKSRHKGTASESWGFSKQRCPQVKPGHPKTRKPTHGLLIYFGPTFKSLRCLVASFIPFSLVGSRLNCSTTKGFLSWLAYRSGVAHPECPLPGVSLLLVCVF